MMTNNHLNNAKRDRQDEFYTPMHYIEDELEYYKELFKDKVIYCNCDNPRKSNFFKYFLKNFNKFGIKRLISTYYEAAPNIFEMMTMTKIEKAYMTEINRVDDIIDLDHLLQFEENKQTQLKGTGDFSSRECREILNICDIVVTNPPFSLFGEFIDVLIDANKDFIVIGNTNAITYRNVFKYIIENKMTTGYTNFNNGMWFVIPSDSEEYHKIVDGKKMARVSASCWYTSFPIDKNNEFIELVNTYNEKDYPKYDKYDAINVSSISNIPKDYYGVMGVPKTIVGRYNPKQFKIVGELNHGRDNEYDYATPTINGEELFGRVLIQRVDI